MEIVNNSTDLDDQVPKVLPESASRNSLAGDVVTELSHGMGYWFKISVGVVLFGAFVFFCHPLLDQQNGTKRLEATGEIDSQTSRCVEVANSIRQPTFLVAFGETHKVKPQVSQLIAGY